MANNRMFIYNKKTKVYLPLAKLFGNWRPAFGVCEHFTDRFNEFLYDQYDREPFALGYESSLPIRKQEKLKPLDFKCACHAKILELQSNKMQVQPPGNIESSNAGDE